jgi:hypothetical protein
MNTSVRRDFERAVQTGTVHRGDAENPKSKIQNPKSKRQRLAWISTFAAAARAMRIANTDENRHHECGEVMVVIGQPGKTRLSQLDNAEFGTVLWTWSEVAAGRMPAIQQIIDRFKVEKRKQVLWLIERAIRDYRASGRDPWTILKDRFKVGIWQELVEITPMDGPMGLKQILWTLTNRVGASGKREAESGKRVQA